MRHEMDDVEAGKGQETAQGVPQVELTPIGQVGGMVGRGGVGPRANEDRSMGPRGGDGRGMGPRGGAQGGMGQRGGGQGGMRQGRGNRQQGNRQQGNRQQGNRQQGNRQGAVPGEENRNRSPQWDRVYVAPNPLPQSFNNAIRQLSRSNAENMISAESLQRVVTEIFGKPRILADAISETSIVIKRNPQDARAFLTEMVRVSWIEEYFSTPSFDRPVFIVSAPRSGSNLLFEQMCKIPGLWNIGGESHEIFDGVLDHRLRNPEFESVRATAADASVERTQKIVKMFTRRLKDSSGTRYLEMHADARPNAVRVLDKLPKNSFRVPFLNASFPDARFVFLTREPKGNISSIIEAWREGANSGRFVTYPQLQGANFRRWCLVLPPGWKEMSEATIEEIAAFQWRLANETILADLEALPRERWCTISYADLVARPEQELRRLCEFIGEQFDLEAMNLENGLELSRTTLTPPDAEKWKKNAAEIERVLPSVSEIAERVENEVRAQSPTAA